MRISSSCAAVYRDLIVDRLQRYKSKVPHRYLTIHAFAVCSNYHIHSGLRCVSVLNTFIQA